MENSKVTEIIKKLRDAEEICESDELQSDLHMDSLALVTLLVDIEEQFDIELKESDMNPFDLITVRDVCELVRKYTDN